ncbi:MAG: tail fiber domain-containing protein [Bacteroidia bacterium]|nr:tail fiber domain-containing protein [Bacteroidia bacterium]
MNGIYPKYTVAVPTPTPGYNNATGTYSFNQGAYSNTINLSPNLSLSGTTLSVAGNTVNLPGLDLWTSPQPTAVVLTNGLGSVGIATTSPTHRFHVVGNTLLNGVTEIGGTAALAAQFKVINSFGHNLSLLVNGSAQSGQLTVGNNGNVTIGNTTTAFSKLFIQHNDANTTGASGTYVNLQNIANAIGTTAGLRFRVGGGGAQQGDFNYKGGIYFVHNGGTTGQGDLIFSNNGQGDNTNATLTHSVMTITSAGNVGIGTSSPAKLFEVAYASPDYVRFTGTTASGIEIRKTGGSDWRIESNASGYLEFSRSTDDFTSTISMFESGTNFLRPSTDNLLTLGGSANRWTTVYASNGVINTSDIRDKENINPLGYGLKEVMKLKPVTFYWKNDKFSTKKIGLIAQEIKTVMPELVNDFEIITDEKTGEQTKIEAKKLGVYYSDMIPVLIKAIQEQQAEIILLKEELNKLKK